MKQILLLMFACCICLTAAAQKNAPKWMDKGKKAVVTVTTYGKDNTKLHSGTGFFIDENGGAFASYAIFKGAVRATVTDTDGKEYAVTSISGADDLYDVIRFNVAVPKKVAFLSLAVEPVAVGSEAYLLPYTSGKAVAFTAGKVTEVTKLKDPYSYYKLALPFVTGQASAPILTADGEVFGLAQEDASGNKDNSYAVSAAYIKSLSINSADAFNSVYSAVGIKKAWPEQVDQALVSLFLLASQQDANTYLSTLNDFVATFPTSADGYINRASHYAYNRAAMAATPSEQAALLNRALTDLATAAKYTDKKGDISYNRAKLIYGVAASDTTLTDPAWNIQAAMTAVQQAISEEDLPIYHQLEGDIYFYLQAYEPAFAAYMQVNNSPMASPVSFYWAAKAKINVPNTNISDVIALLDSAVVRCGTPISKEAAPYVLERVDLKLRLMLYKEAIADYDLYYDLVNAQVTDGFFYYREQAKFRLGDLAGALADIQEAIRRSDKNPDYLAEEASVYLRMQDYPKALASIEKALVLAPDFASCYRLRGICYLRQEKKAEACTAFTKAKELGDPVVEKLIKENCK
ncbi:MAG: tetratricopeptide repeat-containing serine protease family protein [Tannerellaceae bacterium]